VIINQLIINTFLKILVAKWNEDFQHLAEYQQLTDQRQFVVL